MRDPDPHVAAARDLMTADLMAVATGELSLPFEDAEKELLRVNEALGLRGVGIDGSVAQALAAERSAALGPALADTFEMTLTVIDGDFPPEVLRDRNLSLAPFPMDRALNHPEVWTDRRPGPVAYIYP